MKVATMSETTVSVAGTTEMQSEFDVFSDALRSLRISGSVLLNEQYAAPWGVAIPSAERLRGLLQAGSRVRIVPFHFVQRGYIEITPEAGRNLIVEAGEIVICFGGVAHRITQGLSPRVQSVEALLGGGENPFRPEPGLEQRGTSLLCGVFLMHDVDLNPLFEAMPPLVHVSAQRPGLLHDLPGVLARMAHEVGRQMPGGSYAVERLLELLCAEALRAHLEITPAQAHGWLGSLKDPVVGRAIGLIHARPGDDWSVKRLAERVALSPSRFAARFAESLGESPMAYVAKWRMNLAGRLLADSRQSIDEIAGRIGYENAAAFHRAFKRHTGVPPAAWRAQQAADGIKAGA
jgi:AraC-like DNA-binding protein